MRAVPRCPTSSICLSLAHARRELPSELREAVATILFMSARCCGELPELETIRSQLLAKTSRDFVRDACAEATAAATGVNGRVLELMSVAPPPASVKLERLERLSREAGIAWDEDAVRSSIIISVAPPDLVATEGQTAWGTPEPAVMTTSPQVHVAAAPSSGLVDGYFLVETPQAPYSPPMVPLPPLSPLGDGEEYTEYTSAADAARCAARSAEKAASAAAAAARLASPGGEPACAASSSTPLGGVQEAEEVPGASAAQTQEEVESEDDLPDTPAASPAPVDTPAPPADDSDDLDALTKRFEALKRRM